MEKEKRRAGNVGPSQRARKTLALVLAALTLVTSAHAHVTVARRIIDEPTEAELYQALLDLRNPWTVMCVAAHPDDEDGATLTVLRRKLGVHTVTLFSTYGEGGQNATGPELYEELGVIRRRETEEAAEIQGSEAYFLGLRDFGFSKSAEETFKLWGHDDALERMVLMIRRLRPDVIITNHDTKSGHGHHQATGRLIVEAFAAAGDPQRFPSQLNEKTGIRVWQPQRLFVRVGSEGGVGNKPEEVEARRAGAIVTVNPNEVDAVRRVTYAEQALTALRRHASQGPWPARVPESGARLINYRLALSAPAAQPLPTDARTVLDGLRLPESIAAGFAPPAIKGLPLTDFYRNRELIFQTLTSPEADSLFINLTNEDVPRFFRMRERLERARALASNITARLAPRDGPVLVREQNQSLSLSIHNGRAETVEVQNARYRTPVTTGDAKISAPVLVPPGQSVTIPIEGSNLTSGQVANYLPDTVQAQAAEPYTATVGVRVGKTVLQVPALARIASVNAVEITGMTPSPVVLTPRSADRPVRFSLQLKNNLRETFKGHLAANVQLDCGTGSAHAFQLARQEITLAAGESRAVVMTIPLKLSYKSKQIAGSACNAVATPYSFYFSAVRRTEAGERLAGTSSALAVNYSDVRVPSNLRVGYVRSYDYSLPNALQALGVKATEIENGASLRTLESYDAVIIDNRGYQAHPWLVGANHYLLDYVRGGGTLIVFYHKTNEWNVDEKAGRPQLAPYPIVLGQQRVTDENAPVTFTEAGHRLLNFPNKLGPDDFKGWVQERGLYYPKEWDKQYSAPLTMSDAGEASLSGGLLAAPYGRGHYIYTSIVWYRQLRAGHPGAYRMLANMISVGKK